MSSKKGKTKVSQNDLRKMMQQMKTKRGSNENGSGGKTAVANKRLLQTDSNSHKIDAKKAKIASTLKRDMERLLAAKSGTTSGILKNSKNNGNLADRKRTIQQANSEPKFSEPKPKLVKVTAPKKKVGQPSGLLSAAYSDSESSDDEQNVLPTSVTGDSNARGESSSAKSHETAAKAQKSDDKALPEGFFDDPTRDAKMRGVETPADKMDREWESFQRQLQHEEDQSEQLIEEEQETGHLDREIEEIDEQIKLYNLVDKLSDKKESVIETVKSVKIEIKKQEDSSSDSDVDEDLLDWREKDAFT
uniref:Zinc finger protein 830-like n=1 Tax=Phallusia mammillata TaxID=59560 RepID=A0A6F9DYE6_9ASCI|nr:zinc finger protein 830-like [Phallusia mammillata]